NKACRRLFGLSAEEMIGQPVTRFLLGDWVVKWFGDCEGPGAENEPSSLPRPESHPTTPSSNYLATQEEATGRRADGSTFPASISMSKSLTQRGARVPVIVHDLSGLKKTEEALRHSEARLRMVLNQVPAILCSTDHRLRIILLTCSVGTGLS